MNEKLYARLKPGILGNRRNLLAAFSLLFFINILSLSTMAPSMLNVFLNSRKSPEFLGLMSVYSRYVAMTLPVLAPWTTVLFLGCCYLTLCSFGKRLPLLPAALLGLPLFFCFRLPVSLLMLLDKGQIFTSLPGVEKPLVQTGILFTALGLAGVIIFLIALFTAPSRPREQMGNGNLDSPGYLIRCFLLSLGISILSGVITSFGLRSGSLDDKGTAVLSGILILIVLIIQISWTVRRMKDAGLSPLLLLLLLLFPEIPLGGAWLMYKGSSLIAVNTGELILSLTNLISAVIFLCIALWPEAETSGPEH